MSDDGISDISDYYNSEQSDYDGDDIDEDDEMISKKVIGKSKRKTYAFTTALKHNTIDDANSDEDDDMSDEDEALVGRVKQQITVSDDEDNTASDSSNDDDDNDNDNDSDTSEEPHVVRNTKSAFGTHISSRIAKSVNTTTDATYDSDDDIQQNKLQTFNYSLNPEYILKTHPESVCHSMAEVLALAHIVRDSNGNIIDEFHKTEPFLTKYERARLLGQRAQQLADNASPFIEIPPQIMNNNTIAEMELQQKVLPFIIARPIPGGSTEYWHVSDLIDLHRT